MAVIGTALGKLIFGSDAFGTRPTVPEVPRLDATQVQRDTLAGNQAILPQAAALSQAVNSSNAAQLRAVLNRGGGLDLAESIIGSQMRGQLSSDVQRQISDFSASQAASLGLSGTGFQAGIAGLRGALTSLQLQQQGLGNFQQLAQLTTPPLMGPQSMFFSPQQRYAIQNEQNAIQFNRSWLHSQVAAAPDPFASTMTQAFIQDEQAIMELVGSVAGMAGGAMACWVAREVYGSSNPRWLEFRAWMLEKAPVTLREFYLRHGPAIAAWLHAHPAWKPLVRRLMNLILAHHGRL